MEALSRVNRELCLIEAALYVAGRPLDTQMLGSILGIKSKKTVERLARTLVQEYSAIQSALEVVELDETQFALQLKPRYVQQVRRLSLRPALSKGPLKTLSFIAYHQPVTQSSVAKARGSHAYQHIRSLEKLKLIQTDKLGKTKILRTTEAFLDYLNLSHNPRLMRRQVGALFKTRPKEEMAG